MSEPQQELKILQESITEIRDAISRDGGDLELLSFEGDIAKIELRGACASCHMAGQTLGGIRRHLSEKIGRPIRVFPAWKD